jgi:hypothetical protein
MDGNKLIISAKFEKLQCEFILNLSNPSIAVGLVLFTYEYSL